MGKCICGGHAILLVISEGSRIPEAPGPSSRGLIQIVLELGGYLPGLGSVLADYPQVGCGRGIWKVWELCVGPGSPQPCQRHSSLVF